jgi:hypothetical protein
VLVDAPEAGAAVKGVAGVARFTSFEELTLPVLYLSVIMRDGRLLPFLGVVLLVALIF